MQTIDVLVNKVVPKPEYIHTSHLYFILTVETIEYEIQIHSLRICVQNSIEILVWNVSKRDGMKLCVRLVLLKEMLLVVKFLRFCSLLRQENVSPRAAPAWVGPNTECPARAGSIPNNEFDSKAVFSEQV